MDAVPRIIWSYWNGASGLLPDVVAACRDSWRFWNPQWDIRMLDRASATMWLGFDPYALAMTDSDARAADVIRCCVVARYGGLWLDASVLLTAPLDGWVAPTGYTGFTIQYIKGRRVYENWAFAAPPGDPFVTAVRDGFLDINAWCVKHGTFWGLWLWVLAKSLTTDLSAIARNRHYLAMHCVQEIVKHDTDMRPHIARHTLYDAEDTAFAYLTRNGWRANKAASKLLQDPSLTYWVAYKMRGGDRKPMREWVLRTTKPWRP